MCQIQNLQFHCRAPGRRGSESKADHLQPCCFGLSFSYIIRGLPPFVKTAPPVAVQRTFNARSLKNPLKVRGQTTPTFLLAQSWRQQMEHDAKLKKARIAAREGISRARVTQVMNRLQLPAGIQAGLLRPPAPLKIHSFSESSLRVLVSCGDKGGSLSRNSGVLPAIERGFGGLGGCSPGYGRRCRLADLGSLGSQMVISWWSVQPEHSW